MATLLLRDEVHPDDLRATSADTSWELGVSELDHLTYLAPMSVLLGEWPGDVNRCSNPSFVDGLTGWSKQLEGGSTVEADYSEGYDDGRSARMTRGTGICWLYEASARSVSEGWQTVFLRVKGTPGARFVGWLHNYSGGSGSVYGPTLVLDGTWQVYTFSQYREAGSYRLILELNTDGATCNVDTVSIQYAAPVLAPVDDRRVQVEPVKTDVLGAIDDYQSVWTARRTYTDLQASQDTRRTKPSKRATEAQGMTDTWSRIWAAFGKLTESNVPGDSQRAKATTTLPQDAVASSDVRQVVAKRPVGVEAITLTDAYSDAWSALRILGETQVGTDTRQVSAKPRWSEAAGLSDNRSARTGKWASEVEPLAEALNRAWTAVRTFAEAHSPGDVRRSRFLTSFIESQTLGETWARTWSALLTVAQAVAPVDVVRKLAGRTLAELQAAGETLASLWTAFLRPREVLTPSDTERAKVGTPKAESVGLYDTRRAKPGLKVTDAQGLVESWSEVWQALRQLPDSLGAADALRKTGRPGFVEGVATLDTRTAKPRKKTSDAIGLVEQLATVWTAFAGLSEALVPGDVRKAKTTRPAQETLGAGDARTIKAIKTATDVVLPQVDLVSLWQAYVEAVEALWPSDSRWALARLRKAEATAIGASFGSVFSARRLFAEASGMVDALAQRVKKIAGDLMQALAGLRARIRVQQSEDVTATGALLSRMAKSLEDLTVLQVAQWSEATVSLVTDVAASDAFGRAWSAFLAAIESTEPGTSLRFATMLRQSETIAANAVQRLRVAFTLAESAALAVLLSWRAWLSWTFAEALTGLDATRAWIVSLRTEVQATVDGLAKGAARAFNDAVTASGWLAARVRLAWTISTAIVDGLWKQATLKKAETSTVADLRAVVVGQYLAATQDLEDTCDHAAQFIRSLADQTGQDALAWWAAGLALADKQTPNVGVASKAIGALRSESVRMWDWWTRRWQAIRAVADLLVLSDVRSTFYRQLALDVTGLADGMTKAIGKAIQLVQSISEWFRQRFLGIYRRYNVRTLPWDATVQEQPWALAVYEVNSQPRVKTTAWPTEV